MKTKRSAPLWCYPDGVRLITIAAYLHFLLILAAFSDVVQLSQLDPAPCLQRPNPRLAVSDCSVIPVVDEFSVSVPVVCSVAESGSVHLWESKAARWESLCSTCRKALLDTDAHAEVRHGAALALGALVAAPWITADGAWPAGGEEEDVEGNAGGWLGACAKARKDVVSRHLHQLLKQALANEDTCASASLIELWRSLT
jgi:hypothetical protein